MPNSSRSAATAATPRSDDRQPGSAGAGEVQRLHVSARYSEAAVFNGVIYLAGMVPECAELDIRSQTANVLAQIDQRLDEAGSDKTRLLRVQIYLSSIADIAAELGFTESGAFHRAFKKWTGARPSEYRRKF